MVLKRFLTILLIVEVLFAFSLQFPKEIGEVKRFDYRVETYRSDVLWIQMPVFTFDSPYVVDLNEAIRDVVLRMWKSWEKDVVSNIKGGWRDITSYTLSFQIRRIDERIVSITFEDYAYLGGAHGLGYLRGLNFDLKTGRVLHLEDLFEGDVDWKSQINEKAKEYFENVKTLKQFKGIKEDQDFFMTDWGIIVFFQKYEYTPYALGYPMVYIPYKSLMGFRKEFIPPERR